MRQHIAFLHTSPVHIETFDQLVKAANPSIVIEHVVAESLLAQARRVGSNDIAVVTHVQDAMKAAAANGAAMVICTCSTIGGAAERTPTDGQFIAARIDRAMADHAARLGPRILVVAALESTLQPTVELINESAAMMHTSVEIDHALAHDAWQHFTAGDNDAYINAIVQTVRSASGGANVVVLAQASMAPAAERLNDMGIEVLSSPKMGVRHIMACISSLRASRNKSMQTDQIRFDDGAAYERYMGKWSQLVGERFIDWLAPSSGLRWLDVGCGNGAFTELLSNRCAPASILGVDPSEAQLVFARTRPVASIAQFAQGDAMALPCADDAFDVAVMPLVIFFVPDPGKGVAEMVRAVSPGGTVAAYSWDMHGGAFPYAALQAEMREMGMNVPVPPSTDASRMDVLQSLWAGAGLVAVDTLAITVQRTFADFDDFWATVLKAPSVGAKLTALSTEEAATLQARLRTRLPADTDGRITYSARANAIKGQVPHG
jgi:trans-aconitate methyltransferase